MTASEQSQVGKTAAAEKMGLRIVSLLLIVAVVCVFTLWTVDPVGSGGVTTFALFLATDLVAVAMISYVQRSLASEGTMSRAPLIAGCCYITLLVMAGIYLLG